MRAFPEKLDVMILGAGPAGLSAALRLMELGHSVGMVEKRLFPRPQIGESLSFGIRNIFSYLGIERLLQDATFLTGIPARVIWQDKDSANSIPAIREAGLVVDRGKLDKELLLEAVRKGLFLIQPGRMKKARASLQGWQLEIESDSAVLKVFSRVILDGRGRKGTLSSERIATAPSSVAVWTHVAANQMPRESLIEAMEDGWVWGSPVSNNRYRLMAFIDAARIAKNLSLQLRELAGQTKLFSQAGKLTEGGLESCSVTSFVHKNPWNGQFIKIGEAAFTLDPLSSSGVEKAMRFSLQTAIAVNTYLRDLDPEIPRGFYEEKLLDSVLNHSSWTKNYYRQAWPSAEKFVFWERRHNFQLDISQHLSSFTLGLKERFNSRDSLVNRKPSASIPLEFIFHHLGPKKLRVSPQIIYKPAYAIQGDFITIKQAIHHPNLEIPIVYLDQVELMPLLKGRNGFTFSGLIENFHRFMPLEKAKKITAFLWYKDLLVMDE